MKAEITLEQVYWNKGLMDFFMREQSRKTMEDLCDRAKIHTREVIETIDDFCEDAGIEWEDLEEMFYDMSTEELAEYFGIKLFDDEETEEDE